MNTSPRSNPTRTNVNTVIVNDALFQNVLGALTDFILLLDRNGIVHFVSRTPPQHRTSELLGQPIYKIIPPEDRPQVQQGLQTVFNSGATVHIDGPLIVSENPEAQYISRLAPINHDGSIHYALAELRDVTQLRQVEDDLLRKQAEWAQMGRVSILGRLTAELAHELFQPLSSISHYAGGCLKRLRQQRLTAGDMQRAVDEITRQCERALAILRRIRQFVSRGTTKPEQIPVERLLNETLALADVELERHQVKVTLQLEEPAPVVEGDFAQLEQVVMNLIINSVEAMLDTNPANRQIEIDVRTIGERVRFIVSNTGPPLPPDQWDRVFESFVTNKDGGLGLGLTIARKIVESHGGLLTIATSTERATAFQFDLPVGEGAAA